MNRLEKEIPKFRGLSYGLLVQVAEGKGIEKDPVRIVYYVHDNDGNYIGKIDTLKNE